MRHRHFFFYVWRCFSVGNLFSPLFWAIAFLNFPSMMRLYVQSNRNRYVYGTKLLSPFAVACNHQTASYVHHRVGSSGMSTEYGGTSYSSNCSPYHRPLGPHCCHNGGCFLWDMLQCDVLSPHICSNRYVRSRVFHGTLTFRIIRWFVKANS